MPRKIADLPCGKIAVRRDGPIKIAVRGTGVSFELDPGLPEPLLRCLVRELPITAPMYWDDLLDAEGKRTKRH